MQIQNENGTKVFAGIFCKHTYQHGDDDSLYFDRKLKIK